MAKTKEEMQAEKDAIMNMNIKEKLMRIQTEMKAPKNLRNNFGNYNYRNAEGILEALKPYELKYGVATILTDEIIEITGRFYVKAIATIMDISTEKMISATAYAREDESKKGMDGSQITGASSSYARKYALNALFLLDDSKDADSDEYHIQTTQRTAQSKPEPQRASPAQATAPAQHSKEDIKEKYHELISFCKDNGYDLKAVCTEFKLNAKSTWSDFDTALRRLIYNKMNNDAGRVIPQDEIPDAPLEV